MGPALAYPTPATPHTPRRHEPTLLSALCAGTVDGPALAASAAASVQAAAAGGPGGAGGDGHHGGLSAYMAPADRWGWQGVRLT